MDNDKYLEFAVLLAKQAGDIMKRYFQADDIGTEWKEDNTPLTVADTMINKLVIDKVKETFSDHGVIGEEASFEVEKRKVWVVDPIDGTIPYSLGIPISTFSLALVDKSDGQSVVAVVLDPQLDNLYTASKGKGAFLNDKPIKTSSATDFHRNYFSVIGGTDRKEKINIRPGVCSDIIRDNGGKYLSFLSQVYSATKVASGEMAGSIFGYGSPWDSAAVCLLVEEAGGVVTDLSGNKRRYDVFADGAILSANQEMHKKLLEIVKDSQE